MMPVWLLLCLMALSSTGRLMVSAHMMPEDQLVGQWNATEHPLSKINVSHSPSIEIVGKITLNARVVEVGLVNDTLLCLLITQLC